MSGNSKLSVGLDIGSFSVKVVELEGRRFGKTRLCSLGVEKIEPGASKVKITEAIRNAFREAGPKSREVNISISGQDVVTRYIYFPKMGRRDLLNSLRLEIDKYIPYKLDEVVVDYHILELETKTVSLKKQMTVLLIAAKRVSIEERVKMVREAGLEVCLIDVDSFALINAFKLSPREKKENLIVLLNIGNKTSNVNILKNGISCFSRDIMIGGNDLTQAISQKLNIESPEAERLKCNPPAEYERIFETLRIKLNNLLNELRLSFDYCEKQVEESIAGRIYLSGGGAQLKGLDVFLSENLEREVEAWDAAANLYLVPKISREDLHKHSPSLAVGIGLALAEKRGGRKDGRRIW